MLNFSPSVVSQVNDTSETEDQAGENRRNYQPRDTVGTERLPRSEKPDQWQEDWADSRTPKECFNPASLGGRSNEPIAVNPLDIVALRLDHPHVKGVSLRSDMESENAKTTQVFRNIRLSPIAIAAGQGLQNIRWAQGRVDEDSSFHGISLCCRLTVCA